MKKITLLLILIITFQSFSQIRRIDNADWLLHNMIISSENHFNPVDSNGDQVYSSFGDISGVNQYFSTSFCDTTGIELVYDENSSSFTVSSMGTTLGGCDYDPSVNISTVEDIHNKFINFFSNNGTLEGNFNYEITLENLDLPRTLTVEAPNGDTAFFIHSEYLSFKEFSNLSLKIYPNPVADKLFILSENKLKNYGIQIFDVLGKVIVSKQLSNLSSINVESLSKGVYVLRIKDDLENTITKKFVKI